MPEPELDKRHLIRSGEDKSQGEEEEEIRRKGSGASISLEDEEQTNAVELQDLSARNTHSHDHAHVELFMKKGSKEISLPYSRFHRSSPLPSSGSALCAFYYCWSCSWHSERRCECFLLI